MSHEFENPDQLEAHRQDAALNAAFIAVRKEVYVDTELPEPSILEQIHAENLNIEVRPYQVDCLNALQEARHQGKEVALVQMATGLGKTTVVASDVKKFLQENPDSRVLFLCHQKDILRQARKRFESILPTNSHTFGEYHGDRKDEAPVTCLFASFQTMRDAKEKFRPDEFDYIVVDESHHGKATTYEPTLHYFNPKFLLGVTATPNRGDLKNIREIFGDEIYSKPLAEALVEGLLAYPDYRVISDDIEEGLLKDESISLAELNRKIFIPKRDEEIAKIINEHRSSLNNPKLMVFCSSVEHAERMSALIEGSQPLHSKLSLEKREAALKEFLSGDDKGVVSVNLFNEGVDIADTNMLVFLRSTESETIFLQQLGRGLRKTPHKDSVMILDFVANLDRLLMIEKFLEEAVQKVAKATAQKETPDEPTRDKLDLDDLYGLDFNKTEKDILGLRELHVGSFTFSESTRKIFELIQRRRESLENIEDAPEDWLSVNVFTNKLSISRPLMQKIIGEAGVVPAKRRFRYKIVDALGPEDMAVILDHPALGISPLPEAASSFKEAAARLKITQAALQKVINASGLELPNYKYHSILTKGLSADQLEYIRTEILKQPQIISEGWLQTGQLARVLGVNTKTIVTTANTLGFVGQVLEKGMVHKAGTYYSPEAVDRLSQEIRSQVSNRVVPEGWLSMPSMKQQYGINQYSINTIADELGIKGERFAVRNRMGIFYSPTEQHQILEYFRRFDDAPEGWESLKAVAAEFGISPKKVGQIMEKMGIQGSQLKNSHGHLVVHYSPEQQTSVRAYVSNLGKPATEGWLTATNINQAYGIHARALARISHQKGIEGQTMLNKMGLPSVYYSPEQIEQVLQSVPSKAEVPVAPEGYVTIPQVERQLGISDMTVLTRAQELGMTLHHYKNARGRVVRHLSPEDVLRLAQISRQYSVALEGYLSLSRLAKQLGASESAIKRIIEQYEITGVPMRDAVSNNVFTHFSPLQQALIRQDPLFTASEPPEGYKLRKTVADEAGISRETIKSIAEELGIKAELYRSAASKRIIEHYSPAQIQRIYESERFKSL
jgi:superfamily II DNA or RNA helicase